MVFACAPAAQTQGLNRNRHWQGRCVWFGRGRYLCNAEGPHFHRAIRHRFQKGNTALAKTVKEQLDAMWTDGTFKKIAETWGQGLPDMLCYDEAKVVTPAGSEEIAADASRKTLTLGFDAEYPLTAIRTTKETTSASTSTLPKKFASGLAGSSSSSPSIGIPRIWSSTPEISTSSGMA